MQKINICGQPQVEPLKFNKKTCYKTTSDYKLVITGNIGVNAIFKKGFIYDGASVPRFAWSILGVNPGGMALMPALMHDVLYIWGGNLLKINKTKLIEISCSINSDTVLKISRKQSDILFYELMLYNGFNKIKCKTCYAALRMFGALRWNRGYVFNN